MEFTRKLKQQEKQENWRKRTSHKMWHVCWKTWHDFTRQNACFWY